MVSIIFFIIIVVSEAVLLFFLLGFVRAYRGRSRRTEDVESPEGRSLPSPANHPLPLRKDAAARHDSVLKA